MVRRDSKNERVIQVKTYKFKLYNSKRNKKLHKQIDIAGLIYNHCIALHKRYYKLFNKSLNKFRLQKHITKLTKITKYQFWKNVGSQAIQDITDRIANAYKLFFENLKRKVKTSPPGFKKVKKYSSFTLKQAGYKYCGDDNSIIIQKQKYRFFKSREIEGKIKTLTVKRDKLGDIYIYFVCDVGHNEVLARTGKSVGYDFGMKKFLTSSDGIDVIAPEFFRKNSNAIATANRNLSRKKKGSNNRKKAVVALERLHKRIANQRNDFHWKLAWRICSEYATICIEDLNLKGMQRLFGRKISDYGFSDFVNKLEYTASKTGSRIVKIDRYYPSSQLCHSCGYQNHDTKDLNIREWTCPNCGVHHDRDANAAINILNEGLRIIS